MGNVLRFSHYSVGIKWFYFNVKSVITLRLIFDIYEGGILHPMARQLSLHYQLNKFLLLTNTTYYILIPNMFINFSCIH